MTETRPHVLIVDDDPDIRRPLARFLEQHGFRTALAANGRELDAALGASHPDLIVLDVMMPGEDGLSICRRLRDRGGPPVLLLTARSDEIDRILGLELGADDYLPKPFNPRELVARVKAILRRAEALPRRRRQEAGVVRFDRWQFDLAQPELHGEDGETVALSSGEHALLVAFVVRAGLTLTRDQLLDLTRGREAQLFDRSIDNQVSRLRRKIEPDAQRPRLILTRWGSGYVFAAELTWLA
ncbi:response regulator [Aquincola sp. S2]|uniref:Response regulator n=1 Tax=Pseudaquabacterium terrae TaxID=2732868 RepID=A0ABX2EER1_9BURK|nr:response regulator [Aquabacterium terrae]NRF67087.1 response regulator [Aquabacterium terrae]